MENKAAIPTRQRTKTPTNLSELEVKRREKALFECALALEEDSALRKEMEDWKATQEDGLRQVLYL